MPEEIRTVLIAGAGIMGASLAQIFAREGYEVILFGHSEAGLSRADHMIRIAQRSQTDQGKITPEQSEKILSLIRPELSEDCFSGADFVLETVTENMEIKHALPKKISEAVSPDTVIATNTSGLSITKIAEAVKDPGRFAGMHFVNPPHLIPLVEIIAGEKSRPETLDMLYSLAGKIRHEPVKIYHDPRGFVLNRLQMAVVREACYCAEQGYASPEDIDKIMKCGLGMRYAAIGPFETMDFGNIETFYHIASYLNKDLCSDAGVPPAIEKLYREGHLGVKTGSGFYDYSGDKADRAMAARDEKFMRLSDCLFGEPSDR